MIFHSCLQKLSYRISAVRDFEIPNIYANIEIKTRQLMIHILVEYYSRIFILLCEDEDCVTLL